jgi:hypothetical protein
MLNVPERPPSTRHRAYSPRSKRLLGAWLGPALGWTDGRVQVKQRGNVLHVLCESSTGPDRASLTARLRSALNTGGFLPHLTPEGAIIHRLVLYGRVMEATKPSWGETFELEMAKDGSETTVQQLSRQLSRQLSQYNVAVRIKRKAIEGTADYRLYVVCESAYSPDLSVIAEPLAECLRSLPLRDCQYAIVSGQVKGESEPDWMVRVDLTPADQILRSRSQWGDVVAMERLLQPLLSECCQAIIVTLETTTLHVVCRHDQITVPQTYAVKRISDFLNEVAPQGIRGASIYGVMSSNAPGPQTTLWTHWLDLPAIDRIDLSPTPENLIKRGSLTAIGQLLTQQLNPDIDQQLATGGIRVQVRQRETVLHIMTDALKVPPQSEIVARIKGYLTPLGIEGITGFCIYGRRAGQSQSDWQQGLVLGQVPNQRRLVPRSVPEFTASDSYVEDLMSPPGEIVFVPSQPDRNWGEQIEKLRNGVQWILLKTPFFTPVRVNQRITSTADERLDGRVAIVWGLLGVCLMVTGDWAIGLMVRSQGSVDVVALQELPEKPDLKSDLGSLPSISLNRSGSGTDLSAFNSSDFTSAKNIGKGAKVAPLSVVPFKLSAKKTSKSLNTIPLIDPGLDANLPSSPLQPKAAIDLSRSPYPNLNSPQLDERLALYQQYVSAYGVPDVLVVGSSRALRGIDPSALQEDLSQRGLDSLRVFNFGVNGATAQVVDLVLRRLIAPDQLPKIIVWADGARAFNSGRTDVTYNAIASSVGYRKLPEQPISPKTQAAATAQPEAPKSLSDRYRAFDEMLQNWVNGISSGGHDRDTVINLAREKILGNPIAQPKSDDDIRLANTGGMTDVNGFLSLSNQFNPATYYQKYSKVPGTFDSDYDSFSLQGKQQDALRNIASFAQARKISLVFVNLPLTTEYLDVRRSEYETAFTRSMAESATDLKFTYRDLSKALNQENALFSDPSHLNRYGAYAVAQRLANDGLMPWRRADRKN